MNAPSADELDDLIARLRVDVNKYVQVQVLAGKIGIDYSNLRKYMKAKGITTTLIIGNDHRRYSYVLIEDAKKIVEQRAKEGRL